MVALLEGGLLYYYSVKKTGVFLQADITLHDTPPSSSLSQ